MPLTPDSSAGRSKSLFAGIIDGSSRRAERKFRESKEKALAAFDPESLGFTRYGNGWEKEIPGVGDVVFAPLSWEHNQLKTVGNVREFKSKENAAGDIVKENKEMTAVDLHYEVQKAGWGLSDMDVIPSHLLSTIKDTGGMVMVAYLKDKGWTEEGWLGYSMGFGGPDGLLVSHQLTTRKIDSNKKLFRGKDIGRNLKLLQAYDALTKGYTHMKWTYDPILGTNAKLNIEKLGGDVEIFTIDKYGIIPSKLYNTDPTDRFTLEWDLFSEAVQNRARQVETGEYKALSLEDIKHILVATPENIQVVKGQQQLLVEIPVKLEQLNEDGTVKELLTNEEKAEWRQNARVVLRSLMTTEGANIPSGTPDPAMSEVWRTQGDYKVVGFATDRKTHSYYVLKHK